MHHMRSRAANPGRGYAFISALLSLNGLMCQLLFMGSRNELGRQWMAITPIEYRLLTLTGPAACLFAIAAVGYAVAAILRRARWDGALALGLALVALMATSL
jgi:hypothetical protein